MLLKRTGSIVRQDQDAEADGTLDCFDSELRRRSAANATGNREFVCYQTTKPARSEPAMLDIVPAFGRIGEENAFAVLARATELQRQGKDIINLGIGQPDFATPPNIVEAAIR
ncbi:MAG TPA: hypothetical protein PLQ11_11270, partial [Beijerinckiaceae bacterium]|nr:hypothetical protein [Beijerinckiaceae bacterium]